MYNTYGPGALLESETRLYDLAGPTPARSDPSTTPGPSAA